MKDDTVSRAAVMQSLTKEYNRRRTGDGLKLAWIEKAVNDVPAAQTCEDAVSRQQAIDVCNYAIDLWHGQLGEGIVIAVRKRIEQLPAVQPEPKPDKNGSEPFGNAEMLSDRTTDDCISRQAAIDAIGKKSDEIYKTKQKGATYPHDDFFQGMAYAENVVKHLPSAQPEIIGCEDCKHRGENPIADGRYWCERHNTFMYYCSDAERRTDEQTDRH